MGETTSISSEHRDMLLSELPPELLGIIINNVESPLALAANFRPI